LSRALILPQLQVPHPPIRVLTLKQQHRHKEELDEASQASPPRLDLGFNRSSPLGLNRVRID
ncbi:MAG: hypothetical protein ACO3A2_03400, partial [Bdellovibrionia bacterium]